MKKLFCFTMVCVAFSAIGSQRGIPIQEYFGPARSEQPKGPQPTGPQPINHSFGHNSPYSGYYGPGRKELDEQWERSQGSISRVPSGVAKDKSSGK